MRLTFVLLVFFSLAARVTQAVECLEPSSRVISRWKNGNYYKGEIDSITNRVNVLFDNGARLAYSSRDNVDIVVDRIPDHNELPWGSQILVNRPRSRAFEIGYIRDIKNGRFVILYENGDEILHTLDQIRAFNKSRICDEPAYLGCFRDNLPRDLQVYIPTHPATIGACVDTCKLQGFSIGALRNSDLCFCGNSYSKSYQVEEKECDMPCYDNSYEVCGGFMTFSQYWTGIVDSPVNTPPIPGMQKHFIPSNHPIPWELLMHARSKYPSRYLGSARSAARYQNYPWNLKGKNVALLQQQQQQPARRISNYPAVYRGKNVALLQQQQPARRISNYPAVYRGKPLYLAPGTYQRYMQYYRTRPHIANNKGLQLPKITSRYNYRTGAQNSQPIMAYGAYQRPAYRWPYNYNYNNYNLQNRVKNRPYNGYQNVYQRRPAPKPSPQEQAKLMILSSPRFMGCFQDSKARDLPTEVHVRPMTIEGCVTKCGQSGFSMAGLQSSTLCLCGTTYSRYGRLRDEHCTMRCSGNYKEICGGFMMNSIYYTGVGQAIPYDTKYGPRTQKITFTTNKLFSPHAIVKPQSKPKLLSFKKPSTPHKVPPLKEKVKAPKVKDKAVKNKTKKPKQLKNEDKGRPITIQDYGKLRKILQSLSRWQQKPHELRHSSEELTKKPIPSYNDLRKILEDMTPEIVKKIAHKIITGNLNRTRLSDMKPLRAVHSMEVNLAASKAAKDKDTGFKRINVDSSNFKNWNKKGSNRTQKARKTHENVILEADAQPYNRTSKNSAAANEKGAQEGPLKNDSFNNGSQVSSRPTTQKLPKVQHANGNKTPKLPSFIPTADKGNGNGSKRKPQHSQKTQDANKQPEGPLKDIAMSDVQSNKRNFVHFVITKSKEDKKIQRSKIKPPRNKTHFNETEKLGHVSHYQVNDTSSVSRGTKENNTSRENQTYVRPVTSNAESSGSSEDVDEVFETYDIPVNNTFVKKDNKTTPKNVVKVSKKVTKTKGVGNKRRPQKVLHVEAKWNGQINVKANWKEVDGEDVETKPKKSFSVKRIKTIKTKPKKTLARQKADESSGEEKGSEEYNFDDNGSRNDLIWKDKHPLKEKSK